VSSDNHGFTLVEFLVAVVILMVGLLGLLQAVNVGLVQNVNSQLRNEGVSVADWHLAREMSKSFDLVSTTTKTSVEQRPLLNGFKLYSVTRTGTPLSNSKQVNIRVSWRNKGARYSQEATSVISKHQ
jgi:type IV pilus assembly protein PilV